VSTIIPAIDLKDGRCVRLCQGRADDSKIYSHDPVETARYWVSEGATYLHVVDLDGAFKGRPVHTDIIGRMVNSVTVPVEVGGGLRTDEDIRHLLDRGVDRVVIGSRAFAEQSRLGELVQEFESRLAVGIDARDGMVRVKGWVEGTGMQAIDLAAKVDAAGIETLIYTDTVTDGMMAGPNVKDVEEICSAVNCNVIASGGITSAEDIRALARLKRQNLVGIIVGKSLYERRVSLRELMGVNGGDDGEGVELG